MARILRIVLSCFALVALAGVVAAPAQAETIIDLTLGADPPFDMEFDGTTLSTINDGNVGTPGDQNTRVEYLGFLDGMPDIMTPIASFTFDNLVTAGSATVFSGVLAIQNFTGGNFSLWDDTNTLLLSGTLTTSTLTGTIGPPATGAVFSTAFGSFTGGTLAPQLVPSSLTMSMNFTSVNGGVGFTVDPNSLLNPFMANATMSITALEVPEPSTTALALLASVLAGSFVARGRYYRKR